MQQQAKELEEKLKKEREEAAAREKARREAEDRERRKRELEAEKRREAEDRERRKRESEAAEKSRREAEERERQRGVARQKKEEEDENLVLGRYAEEFISSYPYVRKGERCFKETYVAMYRAQVNIPAQEKVLLAANVEETRYKSKVIKGTVFTDRGIYYRGKTIDKEGHIVLKDRFTSWKKFAVSKLVIRHSDNDWGDMFADIITLNPFGHSYTWVDISGEGEIAQIFLWRESMKTQRAIQYEFFPALQQYLLSKM